MKKLTNREKFSLVLVAIVAIFAFVVLFFKVMLPNWKQVGSDITIKENQLDVAQKLVTFETTAMALEDRLQRETGLQGKAIISDELFKTLREQFTVDNDDEDKLNINLVGKTRLARVDGVDSSIASSILAYKKRIGKFEKLQQLKKIRGSIFDGENPQAVISRRLSQIAHQNGIGKIGRLEPKLYRSKKPRPISPNAKKTLVNEIYLSELDTEIQALKKMNGEDEKATGNPEIAGNREFPILPPGIPVQLRLQVAKDILAYKGKVKQKSAEFKGATIAEAKDKGLGALNAIEDEVYVEVLDKGRKGFLGMMAKPALVRVSLREDEQQIIAAFRQAITAYNEEIADAIWEEEEGDPYDEGDYGYWDEGGFGDDDFFGDIYEDDSESSNEASAEGESGSSSSDSAEKETPGKGEGDKGETDVKSDSDDTKSSGEEANGEKKASSTQGDAPETKKDDASEEDNEKGKQESEGEKEETDVESDSDDTESSGEEANDEKEELSTEEDIPEAKQDDASEEDKQESVEDKIKRAQINEDAMVLELVDYLVKVSDTKERLRKWLNAKSMPSKYLKEYYVVEMSFKCELGKLIKFIHNAESQLKWLYVRGLKISISDKKKTILNADVVFVATII